MGSAGAGSLKFSARQIAFTGVLGAITVVLGMTPQLGFIQLPGIAITTMHIPTILAGIIEGPVLGGVVGAMFGLFSMWQAQNIGSPVEKVIFSNPVIAVLPRILIGIVAYYVFALVRGAKGRAALAVVMAGLAGYTGYLLSASVAGTAAIRYLIGIVAGGLAVLIFSFLDRKFGHGPALAAAAGSLTNTVLVLGLIVAFGHMPVQVAVGIGLANGLPEAAVAVVLTSLVYKGTEGLLRGRKSE
jgi:uncharacterized membrane protein